MLLLKNCNIFDSLKGQFFLSDILVEGSKIKSVKKNIIVDNLDTHVVDVKENIVCPGFIDAHSHIGMWTLNDSGNDANECVKPLTPVLRAIDGLNPYDEAFKEAYSSGITTVMICPGSGNAIGGQAAIIKTYGTSVEDMIIKSPAAMKLALGENPKNVYSAQRKSPSSRMATAFLIKEMLNKAEKYYEEEKNGLNHEYDEELEAFLPVFNGEMPLKIHVHRLDDIMMAIRIAEEFQIDYTLDHCTEGYLAVEYIKEKNVPVMLGPLFSFATKVETRDASAEAPRVFNDKGVLISLISDHPFMNCKFLPLYAGLLSRYGLDMIDGLKALTINPAKALNIDDRVGSIEEEKDADLVVFNGEPLETTTKVLLTIINGNIVYKDLD
ncbi:amidohydrolase [Sporanaerobacter acetigenes]|uniref:Imidazolonepropionase n=1 Tax=Sporanaerobacter acetigenes DSM 13106 TaxID=1123281 RepID=A0A1M5YCG0_9FIRM|nr:amidohydrolase [Sporanaerobacter acetigenes]SHI09528.1 Imidazolonepropionase [Sporanaerobacter acetigenes DSM 13106]